MDVLDKTKGLKVVSMLKALNIYPYFRKLEGSNGTNVVFKEKELVMLGSNNYLGLTHHPDVIKAGKDALDKWGAGCTGSRFLNGNLAIHEELEESLAYFLGFEKALVFSSGFLANQGAISALAGKNEHIISDDENHACIIEGCRLSSAKVHVYQHNNMKHLEEVLQKIPKKEAKLIITDGVFSMTGHIAKLDAIVKLAKKYNARTYVDDAHALGTIGQGGRGTANHFGVKSDLLMGTFSKTLASQGGFICGEKKAIEWIKHNSRPFIFTAALSPANAACVNAALKILMRTPSLVDDVNEKARYLKNGFDNLGLNTMGTETCIIPIFIGDDKAALKICNLLLKEGVFATPVVFPAVPKNHAVIRCSVIATHTLNDLDVGIRAFEKMLPMIQKANKNADGECLTEMMGEEKIQEKSSLNELHAPANTSTVSSPIKVSTLNHQMGYMAKIKSNIKSFISYVTRR